MNTRSMRFRLAVWHAALLAAAFVVLGGKSVLAPMGLRHVARTTAAPNGGSPAAMALGVGVVVLSMSRRSVPSQAG